MFGDNPSGISKFANQQADQMPSQQSGSNPEADYGTPYGDFQNPYGSKFLGKYFNPSQFVAQLMSNPATRDYTQIGDETRALGVSSARAGESQAIQEGQDTAANQGLGRAAGAQLKSNIRQQGTEAASEMVLGADMEQRARRFQIASMMTQAGIEGNKSRFASYLQKKALKAQQQAGITSMFSSIFGGALQAGGMIGAAAI